MRDVRPGPQSGDHGRAARSERGAAGALSTTYRIARTSVSLLLAAVFASATPIPGFAHGGLAEVPVTFASGVRMLHEERTSIDSARAVGDSADVARHANKLAALAAIVRTLPEIPGGAPAASVPGDVSRALDGLLTVSAELLDAAGRADAAGVRRAALRLAPLDSILDAHVVKRYACPMHCEAGKTYDRPGTCPVCGMRLALLTDDRYSVQVTPSPATIRAGVPTILSFQIRDPSGYDVTNLEVVHQKLLHLIVVSNDLSWFEHVHPVADGAGRFRLRFTFPAGGTYTLFHDFTTASMGMQVVPVELTVEGARRPPAHLIVDDEKPKRVDGYDVKLTHTWLAPGLGCGFAFWINRNGKPVRNLEPFLGTMGHLIVISEDRATFLHSHPVARTQSEDGTVEFATLFPRIGRYKAWGQFQRRGRVLTVPFTFEVTNRPHDEAAPK